ncbi:MAG: bestrophin-like domain, partial [Isosphaeraceae bacterium]
KQVLSDLVNRIELGIIRLKSPDPLHERLAADCFDQFKEFARARWSLLLAPQNSLPAPFVRMLVGWIMTIFVCLGLRAPANPLVIIVIMLLATTLSSMMFAIIDIVDPYKGLYNISSKNMHYALDAMLRHNAMERLAHSSDAAGEQVLTLTEATRPIKSQGTNYASSHEEPKGVRPTYYRSAWGRPVDPGESFAESSIWYLPPQGNWG